jgi:hypothetical protein
LATGGYAEVIFKHRVECIAGKFTEPGRMVVTSSLSSKISSCADCGEISSGLAR